MILERGLTQATKRKGTFFFSFLLDCSTKTHEREPRKKKERSCWQKIRQLLRVRYTYVSKYAIRRYSM